MTHIMRHSIAIIGPEETVTIFRATGADIYPATTADEARLILNKIVGESEQDGYQAYVVVFVVEDLMNNIPPTLSARITALALPAIVAIPGINGTTGRGIQKLDDLIVKAVGSHV